LIGNTGAWLKERQGDDSYAVNVVSMGRDGSLKEPRIFQFDAQGFLVSQTTAPVANVDRGHWTLVGAQREEYDTHGDGVPRIVTKQLPTLVWPTTLSREMVSVALLRPDRMRTLDLFDYIRHLESNGQAAQRYEIEFWRKVFYPLSCLVMIVLALPFAYLHFRQTGIATYVFGGVMIGISFFLLNNVFGYLGNLRNWSPWITAASPGLIYSVLSLGAFSWLVLRR
jgi:lipopolysaccharide export system permease protein